MAQNEHPVALLGEVKGLNNTWTRTTLIKNLIMSVKIYPNLYSPQTTLSFVFTEISRATRID